MGQDSFSKTENTYILNKREFNVDNGYMRYKRGC